MLKSTCNFVLTLITNDFSLANLKALEEVYENDDITIIICLFHLVMVEEMHKNWT